ncbi:MAG: peptidoglycan-binding protein [Hyphomicrobiales bacterium]|nr:peptidoglycan-binding protein [Hyphomicrobiales bacterium]
MRHSILAVAGGLLVVALAGRFLSDTSAEDAAENFSSAPDFHAAETTTTEADQLGVERLLDRDHAVAYGAPIGRVQSPGSTDPAAAGVHRVIARDLLEPLSSDPLPVGTPQSETHAEPDRLEDVTAVTDAQVLSNTPDDPADGTHGATSEQVPAFEAEGGQISTETKQASSPSLAPPAERSDRDHHIAGLRTGQSEAFHETHAGADLEKNTSGLPTPRPRNDAALASHPQTIDTRAEADTAHADAAGAAQVRRAQQHLARLGYQPGQADGVPGPQTRSAVRAYQASTGARPDGAITGGLLASLHKDAAARASSQVVPPLAQESLNPNEPAPKPRKAARSGDVAEIRDASRAKPRPPQENKLKTWVAAATREIQRAIGREFNSIKQPRTMRTYCRANPETWVYDEGRREMVLCREVADELSAHLSQSSAKRVR